MPASLQAEPLRMVIADDSPESRALLQARLDTVEGLEVVGLAADGRQAIDAVAGEHPDLILLDIAMPVMDGLEAAAVIRKQSPAVKIAMYSGYSREKMGPAALQAGADDYVEKAASLTEMLRQIHALFPERPTPGIGGAAEPPSDLTLRSPTRTAGERRYRLLLDAIGEGVVTIDADGVITDANFVSTQILCIPVGQMLGRTLIDVGLDAGATISSVEGAMNSERPVSNIDHLLTLPDGTTRRLLISVRPLHDPTSLDMRETLVSFLDMTDQRQTEIELATALARMRRSLDATLDPLMVFSTLRDKDGRPIDLRFEEANAAACRLFEMTREQVIGRLICEILPNHRGTALFDAYLSTVRTGRPMHKKAIEVDETWGAGPRAVRTLDLYAIAAGDELILNARDLTDPPLIK